MAWCDDGCLVPPSTCTEQTLSICVRQEHGLASQETGMIRHRVLTQKLGRVNRLSKKSARPLQTRVTLLTWLVSLQAGVTSLERKHRGPFGWSQKNLSSKSPLQQDSVLQGEVQRGPQGAWGPHSSQDMVLALDKELPERADSRLSHMHVCRYFVCTELGITVL